jgi:type II secretory pathway pseudopilin PulG
VSQRNSLIASSGITKGVSVNKRQRTTRRSIGFTLVEVMLAAVISTFVLGSITVSLSQLSRAKDSSKTRLDAHLRADAALNAIRRDIVSVIRSDDLFWTRLLIRPDTVRTPIGDLDRDEILVFNNQLRAIHDIDFNGEGMQYETQYRVAMSDAGAFLWQRRDPVPDEHPLAGGIATPLVEGIVALRFEAYNGTEWFREWDSDDRGLPEAVRITLIASGNRNGQDIWDAPLAHLRTVVAIDRVLQPADHFEPDEDEELEEELEDVSDAPTASQNQGAREGRGTGRDPGRGQGRDPGDARPGDSTRPPSRGPGDPGTTTPRRPGSGGPSRGPAQSIGGPR